MPHTPWQEGGFKANVTVRYRKELVLKLDVETFREITARSRDTADEYERVNERSLHKYSGMVWLYFSHISVGDLCVVGYYLPLRMFDRTGAGVKTAVYVYTSLVWLGFKTTLPPLLK